MAADLLQRRGGKRAADRRRRQAGRHESTGKQWDSQEPIDPATRLGHWSRGKGVRGQTVRPLFARGEDDKPNNRNGDTQGSINE